MSELLKLFIAFLIPGVAGFGGGGAAIGIVNSAVTDTFGLLTQEQMNIIISFSNALPGPIATLLAIGTGFYVKGIVGSIVAFVAMVVPSAIMIIMLYNLLLKYKNDYRVKRITKFILPLIIALFIQLTLNFVLQSFISINNNFITGFILIFTIVSIVKFKIHPAILIIFSMILGYFVV